MARQKFRDGLKVRRDNVEKDKQLPKHVKKEKLEIINRYIELSKILDVDEQFCSTKLKEIDNKI